MRPGRKGRAGTAAPDPLFLRSAGQNVKRESGRKVQAGNITAAKVRRPHLTACRGVGVCGPTRVWEPTCVGVGVCVDPRVCVCGDVDPQVSVWVCEPTGVCVCGPVCVSVDPRVSVWVGV